MKATFQKHNLIFKEPCGTSRGILTSKTSYYIKVWNDDFPEISGIGECSILPGLSPDDTPELEQKLKWCCENINDIQNSYHILLQDFPAVRFALEMAFMDLENGGKKLLFPSDFTEGKKGIPINGMVWMGKPDDMKQQIKEKIDAGFRCIKLKIGALNFDEEYEILQQLRKQFSPEDLEIRVDANGAFSTEEAPKILDKLAKMGIHSIEQPICANQWESMRYICKNSPIPIALDEELIGINNVTRRQELLAFIQPQFIVIKPSLTGGFQSSMQWIEAAEKNGCKWWITSALEGNIGLNAIAQWTATLNVNMPQGLGTGQVFANNTESGLEVRKGELFYVF